MTTNRKLAVAATAVAPSAMSVRSAELVSLKPALRLRRNGGRTLSLAYAGTDARVISQDSRVLGLEGGFGLASNVEPGWQGSERTSVITSDARPSVATFVAACEQQQVEDMTPVMGSTGFAGMHGYPSWRTRT
ncbi:hypothetical protein [Yinghuangia seranimata]|uniref:hypothetical protein n=1 Tax=Yinghuangia seranimata TaxID=408067 RepID=UPI00248AE521|nr:hypothetical protein [Yinghuangia seranimata]MDI2131034.1 hypothetical protein [Yinghuangia seranimata]